MARDESFFFHFHAFYHNFSSPWQRPKWDLLTNVFLCNELVKIFDDISMARQARRDEMWNAHCHQVDGICECWAVLLWGDERTIKKLGRREEKREKGDQNWSKRPTTDRIMNFYQAKLKLTYRTKKKTGGMKGNFLVEIFVCCLVNWASEALWGIFVDSICCRFNRFRLVLFV